MRFRSLNVTRELRGRLIFQMVRFVDDERVIVRQNAIARRRVGQEQRVVDDHEVRALGGPTGAKEEALPSLVEDARTRVTGAFFFGNLAPECLLTAGQSQLSAVAGRRPRQPRQDLWL